MKNNHRDLLLLLNQELMNPKELELELCRLHELLYSIENTENVAIACELLDLNKYKIIKNNVVIRGYLRSRQEKAFVFLSNCN